MLLRAGHQSSTVIHCRTTRTHQMIKLPEAHGTDFFSGVPDSLLKDAERLG